jgi:diacylglycerol kinase (ATP)
MSTDNNKNKFYVPVNWFVSFKIALSGIFLIIKNERNFRIQLVVAFCIGVLGVLVHFSHEDWVSIGLLVALVLISESFNSVIEALSDTLSQDYRVNIKYAKDVAAGAVLISSAASVIAGAIIIIPYLLELARGQHWI